MKLIAPLVSKARLTGTSSSEAIVRASSHRLQSVFAAPKRYGGNHH